MAALIHQRTEATYAVHETIAVDTQDNEDHTFCGIMFPVKCKNLLPLNHIVIRSVAVRGQLGPLTVWISNKNDDDNNNNNNNSTSFRLSRHHWTKIYERVHEPSIHTYKSLELDPPIIMKPGEVRAIYVHSTLPGDEAIVYDNAYYYLPRRAYPGGGGGDETARKPRYDDAMISIYTGRAHVSNTPFGQMPIWGWGNAWRDHREFVGQLEYGAVYKLWNPIAETRLSFGPHFTKAVYSLFICQRKWESPVSMLPDECLFYILHMCRWDWFEDSKDIMKQQLQERQRRQRQQLANDENNNNQENEGQQGDENVEGDGDNANNDVDFEDDDEDDVEYVYEEEDVAYEEYHDDEDDDDDDDAYMDSDEEDNHHVDNDNEEDNDDHGGWGVYVPDHQVFRFIDENSDEDEEMNEDGGLHESSRTRQAWIRRQFVRINILRALAQQDDNNHEVEDTIA